MTYFGISFNDIKKIKDEKHNIADPTFACPILSNADKFSINEPFVPSNENIALTCELAINNAAAAINPTITGYAKNDAKKPKSYICQCVHISFYFVFFTLFFVFCKQQKTNQKTKKKQKKQKNIISNNKPTFP